MEKGRSAWAIGFTAFAAVLMITVGGLHAIIGLAAIFEDEFYVLTRDYVFKFDVTAWGWVHLIAGLVVAAAGFGLFSGAVWARVIGVIVAALSIIANFAFLPWYPVGSTVIIALDIGVIWALTAHGRDIAAEQ